MISAVSLSTEAGLPSVSQRSEQMERNNNNRGGSVVINIGGLKASECLVYTSFSLLVGAAILLGFGVKADQPVILCSVGALFLVGAFILIVVGLVRTLGKLRRKHHAHIDDHRRDDAMSRHGMAEQRAWLTSVAVTSTSVGLGLTQLNPSRLDDVVRTRNEAEFIAYLYRQDLPPSYRASRKFASLSDYEYDENSESGEESNVGCPPPPTYEDVMSVKSSGHEHNRDSVPARSPCDLETRVQLESTTSV